MSDNAFPDALPSQYRLHWYVIERVLGQGGFGITYLARDTNLDQPVAIKEYLPVEVATRRPDATVAARTEEQQERYRWGLERFIREARTLARFDHPHIVRVLSVFELNSTAYMVMRFEEGETLAAMLDRRQSLSEADLQRVLLPILDGLELVHNAGFIHRDIKPDNILIRNDGTPVLLDFGSARYAVGQMRTVTILVAPGYAPFEQYYSSGENQGPWTDIYGLGATCYRAIAGRAPLDAIARSKGILGSTQELLVPAAAVGSGRYSERLLKAIDHALAFAEKDRPQTIAEWRRDLGNGAVATATRTRSAPPLPTEIQQAPPPALHAALQPSRRSVSFTITVAWGVLAVLVAAAAVAGYVWLGPPKPEPIVQAQPPVVPNDAERRLREREQKLEEDQKKLEEDRRRIAEQKAQAERDRQEAERNRREAESPKPAPAPRARAEAPRRAEPTRKSPEPPRPPAEVAPIASATPVPTPVAPKAAPLPEQPAPAPAAVQPSAPAPPPVAIAAEAPKRAAEPDPLADAEAAYKAGDYTRAAARFRPFAEAGNAKAQARLGEFYSKGLGVPQNNFQAYIWYSAAANAGNDDAKAGKQRLDPLLQPAEKQQAEKAADRLARAGRAR
jgi:serine/threonine protein kinase